MNRMIKRFLLTTMMLLLLIAITACGSTTDSTDENTAENTVDQDQVTKKVRIGTKDFTENLIVGELYALALENAGFEVERVPNIAGSIIHASIINDEIDLYPEYTGTGLLSILKEPLLTDPEEVYQTVKAGYAEQFDITWLDYSAANDGQGLVIRTDVAEKYDIVTISDLQKNASEIRFASQGEFDQREDGIPALEKTYGKFEWKSSKIYDNGLKYEVLKNDEADVAPAYTTEGQLVNTDDFTLLVDDKQVWPPYNLTPIVRNNVLDAYPEIAAILNDISARLDTKTITELNAKVDVDKQEYEEVAKDFFESMK
jgi:osmoprotectant transport system substrate-binding protein